MKPPSMSEAEWQAIREFAARCAAASPPPTPEQVTALRALMNPARPAARRAA